MALYRKGQIVVTKEAHNNACMGVSWPANTAVKITDVYKDTSDPDNVAYDVERRNGESSWLHQNKLDIASAQDKKSY